MTYKSRVSNDKGEVIGIVEITEALMKDIHNLVKYVLADRERTITVLTSLGMGALITIGANKYVSNYVAKQQAELNNAQALSVNSAMVALETETLDDDSKVVNDLMGKVYYPTLEDRLKNLMKEIDSLNSDDPSIDKSKLLEEYKKEYAAVVKEAQESGVYYGLGEEHTQSR